MFKGLNIFKKDELLHLLKLRKVKLFAIKRTRRGGIIKSYVVVTDFRYNFKSFKAKDIFQFNIKNT